jgi:hypothetical protein
MRKLILLFYVLILFANFANAVLIESQTSVNDYFGWATGTNYCQSFTIPTGAGGSVNNFIWTFAGNTGSSASAGTCSVSIWNGTIAQRNTWIGNSTTTYPCTTLDSNGLFNYTFASSVINYNYGLWSKWL